MTSQTNFLTTLKYSDIGTDEPAIVCVQSMVGVLQEKYGSLHTIRQYAAKEGYPEPDTFPRLLWWLRLIRKELTEELIKHANVNLKPHIEALTTIDRHLSRLGIAPNPN